MTANMTQNGQKRLGKGQSLGFWVLRSTFANNFFGWSTPSLRNIDDGGKKTKKKKKIMTEIVAALSG